MIASVSGAIYIESGAGDILWGAASSSALHPHAVLLPAELPAGGSECFAGGGCLCMKQDLATGLGDAKISSPESRVRDCVSTSEVARPMMAAIDQAAMRSSHQGLLTRVLFPYATRDSKGSRNATQQEFLEPAGRAMEPCAKPQPDSAD